MTTLSLDFDNRKESDFSQLLTENKTLASELKQCQADKEFVWSLWKRLQVSNPDVTEAISLVIQREREKCEAKDLKVLEILQVKDDRIEELQDIVSKHTQQIHNLLAKKVELQEQSSSYQAESDQLKNKLAASQVQVKSLTAKERSIDDVHRQTLTTTQREKHEMQRKMTELSTELEVVRAEKADSLSKRIDLENKIRMLDREVSDKVDKFRSLVRELEEANQKLQKFESAGLQQEREINYKNRELENVRKELSELWASHNQLTEHASQQAELIRQLQNLQQDTQKMMKNQECAFSMESTSLQQIYSDLSMRYEESKRTETELRQQMLTLKQNILEKDDRIAELQQAPSILPQPRDSPALDGSYLDMKVGEEPVLDLEYKVGSMQKEIDSLRLKLHDREMIIREMKEQSLEFDVSRLNKHERTHSTPSREVRSASPRSKPVQRSRSASPPNREPHRQLCAIKRRLADTERHLELKTCEVLALRKAHGKRLERLRSLQNSHRLVKAQLNTLEDDTLSRKKRGVRGRGRAQPRQLQKEDSDQVWNELTHFKSENRNLLADRLSQQEELDMLRVQAAQDAALVHELNLKLEELQDDLDFFKKKREHENKSKHDLSSELTVLKSSVQNKDASLAKFERQLREVTGERNTLEQQRRELKDEVMHASQECARQRMEIANYKRDIHRLQRELEDISQTQSSRETSVPLSDAPDKSHDSSSESRSRRNQLARVQVSKLKRRSRTGLARQYQTSLNKSIEKMRSVFTDFNEEGWEEISENITTEEDTLTESDTLGRTIVSRSQTALIPDTSESGTGRRVGNSQVRLRKSKGRKAQVYMARRRQVGMSASPPLAISHSNESATTSSSDTVQRVVLRETATSPIPFVSPSAMRDGSTKKPRHSSPAIRQLGSLKQRVAHLQQQISSLRDSRGVALKTVSELKETNQQSMSDLSLANQRLRLAKQNIQRLQQDVERLEREKGEQVSHGRDDTTSSTNTLHDHHNQHEWKVLETRLKVSSNELSRQSSMIRTLRSENEGLQQQVKSVNDKLNHVERDNSQKRTLLESQRAKLKHVQESSKTDADRITELETKLRLITEANDKMKTQVESYRKRMGVAVREKQQSDDKYCKTVLDLEKKSKVYVEAKAKVCQLEESLLELEKTAKQQLHGLATQSEAAVDAAQEQLTNAHHRIQQFHAFIRTLAKELVMRVEQTRHLVKEHLLQKERSGQPVDLSLQKAQDVARNILNLSQSDLEDIMSADGDDDTEPDVVSEAEKKDSRRWMRKCEKLVNNKDFVVCLVNHMLQKVDERGALLQQINKAGT